MHVIEISIASTVGKACCDCTWFQENLLCNGTSMYLVQTMHQCINAEVALFCLYLRMEQQQIRNSVCYFTWSQSTNQANQMYSFFLRYKLASMNFQEHKMVMICFDVQCNQNVCEPTSKTSKNNCLFSQLGRAGRADVLRWFVFI